jgi:leader peptidase (prepilin peptidase)/N-methyltransferase
MTVSAALVAAGLLLMRLDGGRGGRLERWETALVAAASLCTLGAALVLAAAYPGNTFLFNARRLCLLSLLGPAAVVDLRERRIPNLFIAAGLAYWAALTAAEFMAGGGAEGRRAAVGGLAAGGALTAASMICAVVSKGSVGFGDIKLFAVVGLLLGIEGSWNPVLISLFISFAVCVYLLATKRKSTGDSIPFAPSLAAGAFISALLSGA